MYTPIKNGWSQLPRATGLIRALFIAALAVAALDVQAAVTYTTLYQFGATTNGANSFASLIQGADGNLYGTTADGGTNGGNGTVFSITTNGVPTILYSFTGGNDGRYPVAPLVQGTDSNFYGTTLYGGANTYFGVVYKISASGTMTTLHTWGEGNGGAYAEAPLIQGADGNFYGTTTSGGTNGGGIVYKISADGTFTSFHSFSSGNDSYDPIAGLVQGSDGYLYGTTDLGGTVNANFPGGTGTVYKISTNGAFTVLYSFTGGNDGARPYAGLVQGSDGNFYGTTEDGGTNDSGTVFKISPSGAFTSLYSFTGGDDGSHPFAGLVQGSDGTFYGTTGGGGSNYYYGTLYKITSSGAFTVLYSFTGGSDGSEPYCTLLQDSNGLFYGTTLNGGPLGSGVVFSLDVGLHTSGAPRVQFSASPTNGTAPLTVQFSSPGMDSGGNSIVNWNWNFGDGGSSTLQNPSHNYQTAGVYSPSLFVTNINTAPIAATGPQITVSPALSILINSSFGFSNGLFGFDVSGPAAPDVVVEGTGDLQNWTPLQTNEFTNGLIYFSDSQAPTNTQRFYRAVLP